MERACEIDVESRCLSMRKADSKRIESLINCSTAVIAASLFFQPEVNVVQFCLMQKLMGI